MPGSKLDNIIICLAAFLLMGSPSQGAEADASRKAVACPADFVDYLNAADDRAPVIESVYYRVSGTAAWVPADLHKNNSLTLPPRLAKAELDVIYLTETSTSPVFFLIKDAKHSKKWSFTTMVIDYGHELKNVLASEFGKRLRAPFDNQASADIPIDVYQAAHSYDRAAGGAMVSAWPYLFDERRGWHLRLPHGGHTYEDISTRNLFLFDERFIAASGEKQTYALHSQLRKYSANGVTCVQSTQLVLPTYDSVYVEFVELSGTDITVGTDFEISVN